MTQGARPPKSAGRFERLGDHGQSKSVIRFTAPAEVKGVALLVVNHPDHASDQWMWTPAIERDRRIATQDRSTRFFGTDFSFEDLEERDVNQYDYTTGRRGCGGRRRVLEDPGGADSVQGVAVHEIPRLDAQGHVRVRADRVLRERSSRAPAEQLGRFTISRGFGRRARWQMADLRRSSITRLALNKVEYNVPLKDERFTLQAIRRP